MPTPIFGSDLLVQNTNKSIITTPLTSGYGLVNIRAVNNNNIDSLLDIYITNNVSSPDLTKSIMYQYPLLANNNLSIYPILLPNQQSVIARSNLNDITVSVEGLYYTTRNSLLIENSLILSASNVLNISNISNNSKYGISYISIYNSDSIDATVNVYLSDNTIIDNSKLLFKNLSIPSKTFKSIIKGMVIPSGYNIYIETNYTNLLTRSTTLLEQ